jgi:hypothetical protein
MSALATAWQEAVALAHTAEIERHIINDLYLFKTAIPCFYVVAGLHADAQDLAQAVMGQAAIARAVAGDIVGGMQ